MRLKFKPWANDKLNDSKFTIGEDEFKTYKFPDNFNLEIGVGKGDFIIGMAEKNPEQYYLGLEKYPSVLVLADEKLNNKELKNVILCSMDAKNLLENKDIIGKVSKIYLNFSDPWPKARHAKRRLTHENQLKIYKELLTKDGSLYMKTDNVGLFEYTLESIEEFGMTIIKVDRDYNHEENVQTEYERKFRKRNVKINYLEAKFN